MTMRAAYLAIVLFGASVRPAYAQVHSYLASGLTVELRPPSGGGLSNGRTAGLTFAAGVPITDRLFLEFSTAWPSGLTTDWFLGYLFGPPGDQRTIDRDVPFIVALRRSESCDERRVCVDAILGGGVNFHQVATRRLTECISGRPCTPIDASYSLSDRDHAELMVTAGADIRVRLTSRLSAVPSCRVKVIKRDKFLTGYLFRGPEDAGWFGISFGAQLMVFLGR